MKIHWGTWDEWRPVLICFALLLLLIGVLFASVKGYELTYEKCPACEKRMEPEPVYTPANEQHAECVVWRCAACNYQLRTKWILED